MRVHHLSCGTLCPNGGGWIDGGGSSIFSRSRLVCHVLLIETPSSGLVLVDAGLGLEDMRHPRRRLGGIFLALSPPVADESHTAIRQIEALGFDASDVRHIIPTHMDLDHVGALSDFPEARVHLTRGEHLAATAPPTGTEKRRYRPNLWSHGPRFETYEPAGEPWFGFAAVHDLVGLPPEILLIPTDGHSRGHTGVAVESERGWLLHCGDAYFHRDELAAEPGCPRGLALFQNLVAFDRPRMRHNKARLQELARSHGDEIDLFCAHDEVELKRLQQLA